MANPSAAPLGDHRIIVRVDKVYGTRVVYPVCAKAILFASIANTKTLTERTLSLIQSLGFEIEAEQVVLRVVK